METPEKSAERSLIVFAAPAFSKELGLTETKKVDDGSAVIQAAARRDYSRMSLVALPGTAQEVEYLRSAAARWNLTEKDFVGRAATEVAVTAVRSPHILHVATHGFFCRKPRRTSSKI